MNIMVNDVLKTINATNLAQILIELGYQNLTIATAVNGDFVPLSIRQTVTLSEGDKLEILAPMQGG